MHLESKTPAHYAIYQVGYAFFGVGKTLRAAVKDANKWTDERIRERDLCDSDDVHGTMAWVRVTLALADKIRKHGGGCRYEILEPNYYCTPEEYEQILKDNT